MVAAGPFAPVPAGQCSCYPLESAEDNVTGDTYAIADDYARLWPHDDVAQLVSRSGRPAETLANVVALVQNKFATDVCSVYVLEADRANLILAATVGLRAE